MKNEDFDELAQNLPPGWEPMRADDGNVYYYNRALEVSTWDRPKLTNKPTSFLIPHSPPRRSPVSEPSSPAKINAPTYPHLNGSILLQSAASTADSSSANSYASGSPTTVRRNTSAGAPAPNRDDIMKTHHEKLLGNSESSEEEGEEEWQNIQQLMSEVTSSLTPRMMKSEEVLPGIRRTRAVSLKTRRDPNNSGNSPVRRQVIPLPSLSLVPEEDGQPPSENNSLENSPKVSTSPSGRTVRFGFRSTSSSSNDLITSSGLTAESSPSGSPGSAPIPINRSPSSGGSPGHSPRNLSRSSSVLHFAKFGKSPSSGNNTISSSPNDNMMTSHHLSRSLPIHVTQGKLSAEEKEEGNDEEGRPEKGLTASASESSVQRRKKEISKSEKGVKGLTKFLFKKKFPTNSDESVAVQAQWRNIVEEWEREAILEAEQWINKETARDRKWDSLPAIDEVENSCLLLIDVECNSKFGFNIEYGKEIQNATEFELEEKAKHTNYYHTYFAGKEHLNFVGEDDILGPIVLSMETAQSGKMMKKTLSCLLRTKKGDERIVLYRKADQAFPDTPEGKIKALKSSNQSIYNAKLTLVSLPGHHAELEASLLSYERQLIQKNYKFGVLYVKDGQKDENDFFNNTEPSPQFEEFLEILGEKVNLKGFTNFAGGLDVKSDSTGTHSYHTTHKGIQVMFHVSTLLPYFPKDLQQVERKRHLGNDVVLIVFKEGSVPFDPRSINSQFNHVFAVVQVENGKYRLGFTNKFGVKPYGPVLPKPALFEKGPLFREYLLTKLINGERAAMYAPDFRGTLARTREILLKNMVEKYSLSSSDKGIRMPKALSGRFKNLEVSLSPGTLRKRSSVILQNNRHSMTLDASPFLQQH